jgi:ABC-2 type transport system ATP-binding protein
MGCGSSGRGRPAAGVLLMPILEVVDLCKRYDGNNALAGVSFAVEPGEMFGLLGPNGAGKTTLISILSGVLSASSGKVKLLGRDALPMPADLRPRIGLVPQELAIYNELTARENLAFFGALYGLSGNQLTDRVEKVLAAIGLAERADERVETFSGGMKRRLNLGPALVHEPTIILLDEPTTGVDPQSRNRLFEEVRRINSQGITVIYSSHYMEEVQALCTRIGILDRGKLIACDRLSNLLQQLNGVIRFRVHEMNDSLRQRIADLPQVQATARNGDVFELECRDVKATLLRVVALLNELQIDLASLETEEPSLERVFLHLTGRALRD